ncbi:MAG: hypothetical protein U0Q16_31710 [Bryobacteraceae bacterium]
MLSSGGPRRSGSGWTRRGLLSLSPFVPAALCADLRVSPSERVKYADPATELDVFRLTSPEHSALLAPPACRSMPKRGNYLLHASDRGGAWQIYALDLKNYQNRQITEASALQSGAFTLTPDDRGVLYVDGDSLYRTQTNGGKPQPLYRFETAPPAVPELAAIPDGPSALAVDGIKLVRIPFVKANPTTIVSNKEGIHDLMPRPRRAAILYRSNDNALWLVTLDGSRNTHLKTAAAPLGPARWSPDGRTVIYLHKPAERTKPTLLRELDPDTGEDKVVGITSQYAQFSPNSDASVFVGASASLAGPYVLLLVRAVKRELTLCEHKASDPALTKPVFSPDSQRIFFQSDRHGKPAIYSMAVEKLVEKTEEEEEERHPSKTP